MCKICEEMNQGPKDPSRRSFIKKTATGAGVAAAASAGAFSLLPKKAKAANELLSPRRLQWWNDVPNIITRAEWGCDENIRKNANGSAGYADKVEKIIFHHTVSNANTDPYLSVRSIYREHVYNQNWSDIGYNFLISNDGRIFEGRWSGWDHTMDAFIGDTQTRRPVVGAHAFNHNTYTIGIAFLGTFTDSTPSVAARNAAGHLAAWKSARWGIDPLKMDKPYSNGVVNNRVFPNFCGHRDVFQTTCPGNPFNSWIPGIRQHSANIINAQNTYSFQPGTIERTNNDQGYSAVDSNGHLKSNGNAANSYHGDASTISTVVKFTDFKYNKSGSGYWIIASTGYVGNYGSANNYGRSDSSQGYFVGIAPTPSNNGYYLLTEAGRVLKFGDATRQREPAVLQNGKKYVRIATPKTGPGYWCLAEDGSIFTARVSHFGDAAGQGQGKKFVDFSLTSTHRGYYILREDGAVFAYGDAVYSGNVGSPYKFVSIAANKNSTGGYTMLNAIGQVWCLGPNWQEKNPYHGDVALRLNQ
jgi:hypothetical protein